MKKRTIKLRKADKSYLEQLISKGTQPVRTFKRATALLDSDRGRTQAEISKTIGISVTTISVWCGKYRSHGLSFLFDQPRAGRPQQITDEERTKIVALACSEPPDGYARWSLRLLADRAVELSLVEHISHNEVGKILKKTNLSRTSKSTGA